MSCFINVPESNIDIRISQLLNLPDPSNRLTKVEDGENYYRYSNPEPHDKNKPEIDPKRLHDIYINLYQTLIKTPAVNAYLIKKQFNDLNSDRSLFSKENNRNILEVAGDNKIESSETILRPNIPSKTTPYSWFVLIFCFICFLTAYLWYRPGRKS